MPTTINHHVALRTTDLARAARFYQDVFGARPRLNPFTVEGDIAEMTTAGPPGVRMKIHVLGFDDGPAIELYEFLEPAEPMQPVHATLGNVIHFAIQVDDAAATLALLEQHGGRRIWPDLLPFGEGTHIIYVTDPDGNVLELCDISMDGIIEGIAATFEGAALDA